MFTHVSLGTSDIGRSRIFYDALFAAVGGGPAIEAPGGKRLVYRHDGATLLISVPIDGEPATFANGGTVGFRMKSEDQLHAWHAAGVANGGTACEDPPGLRPAFGSHLAYLRDPDGNKLCGMYTPG